MDALLTLDAPPYKFSPVHLSGCQFWFDANSGAQSGLAAQFTAASSRYLSRASEATLQTGDVDFAIACWVYADSLSAERVILSKWNSTNPPNTNREYLIEYSSSANKFAFLVSSDGQSPYTTLTASTFGAPSTGAWYFIVCQHNAATDTVSIQVNNGTVDSTSHSGGVRAGSAEFRIGAFGNVTTEYWDGRVQYAGLWKRTLTAGECTALYNGGSGLRYSQLTAGLKTDLAAYWELREETGARNDSHASQHLTSNNSVAQNDGVALVPAEAGDNVRQWNDRTTNARNVTQTGNNTKRPSWQTAVVNGRPVLRFGANDIMRASTGISISQPMEYFAVAKKAADNGSQGNIIDGAVTRVAFGYGGTVGMVFIYPGSSSATYTTVTVDSWHIIGGVANGTSSELWVDGTKVKTGGGGNNALAGPIIGGKTSEDTDFLNSDLAEVIAYNRVLSTDERKRVNTYLGRRYGITVA